MLKIITYWSAKSWKGNKNKQKENKLTPSHCNKL